MRIRHENGHNLLIGLVIFLLLVCFSPPVKSEVLRPIIDIQQLGFAHIEPANNYSENVRLRIRLLYPQDHKKAGQVIRGLPGELIVSEYVTKIYDGLHGATALPVKLTAAEGQWELTLKSLARYTVPDQRFAPVPRIEVHYQSLDEILESSITMPQWVDTDGNEQMDWLEHRVNDLLAAMRVSNVAEVVEVINSLEGWHESYRIECGGIEADNPYVARIAPSCINWDGENDHRLNSNFELTATILHEARHVWQRRQGMMSKKALKNAPLTRNTGFQGCERTAGNCFTQYVIGAGHPKHLEDDAEAFANRYKSLFP